jgi:hypothetical protein
MNVNLKKISLVISSLLVLTALLILVIRKKNTPPDVSQNNTASPETSQHNSFPSSQKKEPASMPQDEIKTQFTLFGNLSKESNKIISKSIMTPEEETIPIKNAVTALGGNIPANMEGILDPTGYLFFSCNQNPSRKDFGMMLSVNGSSKNIEDEEKDLSERMRAWESNMLKDLQPVIFPFDIFSEEDLAQPLNFKDGEFRYANVILPSGSSSINYSVAIRTIFIATSPECLKEGVSNFFEP